MWPHLAPQMLRRTNTPRPRRPAIARARCPCDAWAGCPCHVYSADLTFTAHRRIIRRMFNPIANPAGAFGTVVLVGLAVVWTASQAADPASAPASRPFKVPAMWEYTAPLIAPEKREQDPSVAQKDPTVVFHEGKWHVFMTVKLPGRTAIEYCSFDEWEDADKAPRTILKVSDSKYYCAPQVFYFAPHKKWYLIYQVGVPAPRKKMWVAYSTTANIADPASWTQAAADPGRRRERPAPGGRAGLLDHLRRPAGLPVLHQPQRQALADVDEAGGLPQGLRPLRARPAGRHLRGQPHLPAQGPGQVPDHRRGERPALLQGLPGRPPGRRVDARWPTRRRSPSPGATNIRPAAGRRSPGPTTSATANSSATASTRR